MNKEKIRKILIIISIIIIGFGIVSGISVSNELTSGLKDADNSAFMIDGSDFSGFAKAFLGIGVSIIGFVVVLFTVAIVLAIWAIYGIVLLIIKIIDKSKMKEENKKSKKYFTIIITLLIIIAFITVIYNNLTDKPREEYKVIEEYISNNYNIELTTQNMKSIDRGDIGINPGKSYTFTMKDKEGTEYTVFVDTYDRNKNLEEILSNASSIKGFNIEKK